MERAQIATRLARPPRQLNRAPGLPPRTRTAMPPRQAVGAVKPVIRSKNIGPQRAQLLAAAASLVWFAGWFQAIYDEIAGHDRD